MQEGRGVYNSKYCRLCRRKGGESLEIGFAEIRCQDCFGGELMCKICCVEEHICNPLHNIEVNTGLHWEICALIDWFVSVGTAPDIPRCR